MFLFLFFCPVAYCATKAFHSCYWSLLFLEFQQFCKISLYFCMVQLFRNVNTQQDSLKDLVTIKLTFNCFQIVQPLHVRHYPTGTSYPEIWTTLYKIFGNLSFSPNPYDSMQLENFANRSFLGGESFESKPNTFKYVLN